MTWLRTPRSSWGLMLVVILAGVLAGVGANKIMRGPNGARGGPAPVARGPVAAAEKAVAAGLQRADKAVLTGIVAPEGDIVPLIPSVKGEVVSVMVKADQQVKKGEVLLRMDDRFAREKLVEAEAGLANAQATLKEATDALARGIRQWELERAIQSDKIAIAIAKHDAASEQVRRLKELVDKRLSATAEVEYAAALKGLPALERAISAEKKGLELVEAKKPTAPLDRVHAGIKQAESLVRQARIGVELCELRAPADGTIMQSFVSVGSKFGEQAVKPAFLFYTGGLIIKAEVNQEWASKVREGMPAAVEDHSGSGQAWRGRVVYVAKSFLPKRDALEIPGLPQQVGEMVLECRIMLDEGQTTPFLNQKVRVRVGQ